MGYRLVSESDVPTNTTVERFSPKYMSCDQQLTAIGSVVTTGEDSVRLRTTYRLSKDLVGLYLFKSIDTKAHPYNRYENVRDWRNTVLSFRVTWSDTMRHVNAATSPPGLAVYAGGQQYDVALIHHVTETIAPNDVRVRIDWSTLKAGFAQNIDIPLDQVEYAYLVCIPKNYEYGECTMAANASLGATNLQINVPNGLKILVRHTVTVGANTHTVTANATTGSVQTVTVSPGLAQAVTNGTAVWVSDPTSEGRAFSSPVEGYVDISEISVTGDGKLIPARSYPQSPHRLGMTMGYDNDYDATPERVVDEIVALGYSGSCVCYIGQSHFFRLVWDTTDPVSGTPGYPDGRLIVDASNPTLNEPCREWLRDFCTRLWAAGIVPIFSISFEILHYFIPPTWAQRDVDGNKALTGWSPPSSLVSPSSEAALDWLKGVVSDYKDLCDEVGCPCHVQLGEGAWWTQDLGAGSPCFYDDATTAAFAADTGCSYAGTGISVDGANQQLVGPSGTFSSYAPGDWVKTAGFASSANNGWREVSAATSTTLTLLSPGNRSNETATATMDKGAGWNTSLYGPRLWTNSFTVNASLNRVTSSVQYAFQFLSPGNTVTFSGFSNPANNGTWTVVSIDAGGFFATFQPAAAATPPLVTAAAGASVTVRRTVPKWESSGASVDTSDGSRDRIALDFLQDTLGAAHEDVSAHCQSIGVDSRYVLILTDHFLSDVDFIQVANTPQAAFGPAVWDVLQHEAYTELSTDEPDFPGVAESWDFVLNTLGYPVGRVEYFGGYIEDADDSGWWAGITTSMENALDRGAGRVYPWSLTQVARDGYVFQDNPQFSEPKELFRMGKATSEEDSFYGARCSRSGFVFPRSQLVRVGGRVYGKPFAPKL